MSRPASFLTALWLSTAAVLLLIDQTIGSDVCAPLRAAGIEIYEDSGQEPDLNKLTLVYMNGTQTYTYNLTDAARVIPNEPWFNPANPFRIFVHGFTGDPSKPSFQTIRNAYLSRGDGNILALDASSQIRFFYFRATIIIKYIGEKLGELIVALLQAGLNLANVHLLGHSLGAHITGFTGKTVSNRTGSLIARITGMDPAGPCFGDFNTTLRLAKGDARLVDVIHTDAGVFGTNLQIGDVDFYPNGGSKQTNCTFNDYCDHKRAWIYYAESVVNETSLIGVKCNSWEDFKTGQCTYSDTCLLGFGCTSLCKDKYFLQTSGKEPYGRGVAGLTYMPTLFGF